MKNTPELPNNGRESLRAMSTESLLKMLESRRISPDAGFGEIYSEYAGDMERAKNLRTVYDTPENAQLGKLAEALVFSALVEGKAGEHFRFRGSSDYDDIVHGVDVIAEPKHLDIPALATIDITINQEDIKGNLRRNSPAAEARPVGLEQKLARVKKYIDHLAEFRPDEARDLQGWLQSGGLRTPHTKENNTLFQKAERVIHVKYYKTHGTHTEPPRPGYVIGGPHLVISLDTEFVNKALSGSAEAKDVVHAIAFLEIVIAIRTEQKYLDTVLKSKEDRNLLFDTHYAKVKAWSHILEEPEIAQTINDITNKHRKNPDFVRQLFYFRDTYKKIFGVEI